MYAVDLCWLLIDNLECLMLTACAAFLRRSSSALGLSASASLQSTLKQRC
jgi:hypothetical protein